MNERKQKIYYYSNGGKVQGLSGYMFFWLPLLVLCALWALSDYFLAWDGDSVGYVISLGVALLGILSLITIHAVDKLAFYSNVAFLALYLVRLIIDEISIFTAASNMGETLHGVVDQSNADWLHSAVSFGVGIGSLTFVLDAIILLVMFSVFFYIFVKNRRLFFTSLKDLKKDYE